MFIVDILEGISPLPDSLGGCFCINAELIAQKFADWMPSGKIFIFEVLSSLCFTCPIHATWDSKGASSFTCMNLESSVSISSSISLTLSERRNMSFSVLSSTFPRFFSTSFFSALSLASSSLRRKWWNFSNSALICFSACWAWDWQRNYD